MHLKAYLILAHENPEQLFQLISLLDDQNALFFVHLDRKAAISDFKKLASLSQCHFIQNRIRCRWGDISLVHATLNGMQEIRGFMRAHYPEASYHCLLLSGSDLPLQSNGFLQAFLENDFRASYLHFWELPYEKWWGGGLFRLEYCYAFNHLKYRLAHKWLNRGIRLFHLNFLLPISKIKKQYPTVKIYGGSQWMVLSKEALEALLDLEKERRFSSFFKYAFAPDELYFATLLLNFFPALPLTNTATHLVKFEGNAANASYLSVPDLQMHRGKNLLFARKFSPAHNPDAIAWIYKTLGK